VSLTTIIIISNLWHSSIQRSAFFVAQLMLYMNGTPRDSLPIKKKRKKSTQAEKTKFRATSAWQKFRNHMKLLSHNRDKITGSPLRSGWNLHHYDLDEDHYTDISDPSHFVALNRKTHDLLHFCYTYYSKDDNFIWRLKEALDRMVEINHPVYDLDLLDDD
jgi:hypothetical protein